MCFLLFDWFGVWPSWKALKLEFIFKMCSWQKIVEIPSRISMMSDSATEYSTSLNTWCLRYSGQMIRSAGNTAVKQQNAKTLFTPCMAGRSVEEMKNMKTTFRHGHPLLSAVFATLKQAEYDKVVISALFKLMKWFFQADDNECAIRFIADETKFRWKLTRISLTRRIFHTTTMFTLFLTRNKSLACIAIDTEAQIKLATFELALCFDLLLLY